MKKSLILGFMLISFLLSACKTTSEVIITTEVTTEEEYVISDPSETRDVFPKEPMRTELKKIDGVNVVYQYEQPVPSFDTWEESEETRNHLSLNGQWYFKTDPDNVGVTEKWYSPLNETTDWQVRPVPSSWDTYDYDSKNQWGEGYPFYDGYAWYKTTFNLDEAWQDQYIKLNFLAVNYRAWVYVNGQYVDVHESGNTSFSLDISDYVRDGKNTIAVRVYRRPDFEDYFAGEGNFTNVIDVNAIPQGAVDYWPYAGITKDVYLEGTNQVTVSKILTNAKDGKIDLYAVVYNTSDEAKTVRVEFDPGTQTGGTVVDETVTVEANGVRVVHQQIAIPSAKEWSYVDPQLYKANVSLYEDDQKVDELHVDYGMREIKVSGTQLLLNDHQIFLKGTNWHEETQLNGRSMTKAEYDLELGLIKEMDMNYIRNSHYNRHPYVYEYTDRYGIMVLDETENMWLNTTAVNHQFSTYKLSKAAAMMTTWNQINHPSVIMWSLNNEVSYGGQYNQWIKEMYDVTKAIDVQKRPVTWGARDTNDPAFMYADVIGFNEYAGFFWGVNSDLTGVLEGIHNKFPNKPILITENGSWSVYGNGGTPTSSGSEQWQAANFRTHYRQTVEHKDYMVGYTFWVLKDYKTRNGYNTSSVGISTMGTVPFVYTQEFVENAEAFGISPHKVVYYSIKNAANPYTYPNE